MAASAGGEGLDYDAIMNMQYLDMVVNETLRHLRSFADLDRICSKEYTVPGTNVTIPKGMVVRVRVLLFKFLCPITDRDLDLRSRSLGHYLYRVTGQDATQEMEGKKATADFMV